MKIWGTLVRPVRSTIRSRSAGSRSMRTSSHASPRPLRKFLAATQYAHPALVYRVIGGWPAVWGLFKTDSGKLCEGGVVQSVGAAAGIFQPAATLRPPGRLTADSRPRLGLAPSSSHIDCDATVDEPDAFI